MKPLASIDGDRLRGAGPSAGTARSRDAKSGPWDAFAKALDGAGRAGKPSRSERDEEADAVPRAAPGPNAHAAAMVATSATAATFTSTATPTSAATPTPTAAATMTPKTTPDPTSGEGQSAARGPARPAARSAPGSETEHAVAKPESGPAASRQPAAIRQPSAVPSLQPRKAASEREKAPQSPLGDAVARAGRERIAHEPERVAPRAEAKLRAPAGPTLAPGHAQPAGVAPAVGPEAPRAAAPAIPVPGLAADPRGDVTGAILPAAAHLRVSSDVLGDVTLHLRLRDGTAHLRVEANAASPVHARAPELARALAAEGITLAKLDVEQRAPAPVPAAPAEGAIRPDAGGGGRHPRDERQARDDAPASGTPAPPRTRPQRRSGHHVTA